MNQIETLPFSISNRDATEKDFNTKSEVKEKYHEHGDKMFEFGKIIRRSKLLLQIGGVYVPSYCPCGETDTTQETGEDFLLQEKAETVFDSGRKLPESKAKKGLIENVETEMNLRHELQHNVADSGFVKAESEKEKVDYSGEETSSSNDFLQQHAVFFNRETDAHKAWAIDSDQGTGEDQNDDHLERKDVNIKKIPSKDTQKCPLMDQPCRKGLKLFYIGLGFALRFGDMFRYLIVIAETYGDDRALVFGLTLLTYLIFQAFLVMAGTHACCKHYKTFMKDFYHYEQKYGLATKSQEMTKRVKIMFTLPLVVLFGQCLFYILIHFFYFDEEMLLEIWPFQKLSGAGTYIVGFIGAISVVVSSCSIYGTKSFRVIVIFVLKKEFVHLRGKLLSILTDEDSDETREEKFDSFVMHYKSLCRMMERSYQILKHTIASSFIFTLPLLCLVLYGVIDGSLRMDQTATMIHTVVLCILVLVSTTEQCGVLHIQICSVWDAVYDSSWTHLSPSLLQKLEVFMNQKPVSQLGLSVYGMMLLDRSTLLMMGGSLLSYGIIVVQFNDIENPTSDQCQGFNDTGCMF